MKKYVFFAALIFFCLPVQAASEDGPVEGRPTANVSTVSQLAGDPGEITDKNAALFKTSDGSSLDGLTGYRPQQDAGSYSNVRYSRTVLTDDAKKLNKEAADFFADEKSRRFDLNAKITSGRMSQADIAEARKDEVERRQDFTRKQQAKLDQLNCKGIKTPACDDVRDRNKKLFGIL